MATLPASDRGQKKKRIVTLALMAIFLMSASFFLIDRKEETIIVVYIGSSGVPLDRAVGHQAVPLKIADLRPGRPVPGELNRLRNRRVPRWRAANDRGGALTARAARAERGTYPCTAA